MIYQVNMMSGQKIPLASKEELMALVEATNRGAKLVITKHGVINPASIDSIVKHKEMMAEVNQLIGYGKSKEESEQQALGGADFADLVEKAKLLN